jgi:hypothetical protein
MVLAVHTSYLLIKLMNLLKTDKKLYYIQQIKSSKYIMLYHQIGKDNQRSLYNNVNNFIYCLASQHFFPSYSSKTVFTSEVGNVKYSYLQISLERGLTVNPGKRNLSRYFYEDCMKILVFLMNVVDRIDPIPFVNKILDSAALLLHLQTKSREPKRC